MAILWVGFGGNVVWKSSEEKIPVEITKTSDLMIFVKDGEIVATSDKFSVYKMFETTNQAEITIEYGYNAFGFVIDTNYHIPQ
jgi:hypothetical protein